MKDYTNNLKLFVIYFKITKFCITIKCRDTAGWKSNPEMSLLTGSPGSTDGCQSALVDELGVSPSRYHHTTVHIAITKGWILRPVKAAVLRRQSHPIITNLPIYTSPNFLNSSDVSVFSLDVSLWRCKARRTCVPYVRIWLRIIDYVT
jgi:hypothetical protein